MDALTLAKGLARLQADEGLRTFAYKDIKGHLTIGYGRNLDARGIRASEALLMLQNDVAELLNEFPITLPWFSTIDSVRQSVLLNMAYNLGMTGLMGFKNMLNCLQAQDFAGAAQDLLDSDAAKLLPARYARLAHVMETGNI